MLGRPMRRREDPRLLRGGGHFVADLRLPGMLHVAFVRSVHGHGALGPIDAAGALALPGVVAVITADQLGSAMRPLMTFGHVPPAIAERWAPQVHPSPCFPLARDRVRFVGEPIAAVVATDAYVAEDAAELVQVAYDPLPVVAGLDAALAPGAIQLHPDAPGNVSLELAVEVGDVDAAFAGAHRVLRDTVSVQRMTGTPMETRGVVAAPAPGGGIEVWSAQQMPHALQQALADHLGLPAFQVSVRIPDVGGGFGTKGGIYPEEVVVAWLARHLGRPVRWIEDRREHLIAAYHGRDQRHELELAVDRDGRILALRDRITTDAGAYNLWPIAQPYMAICHLIAPYRVPVFRCEAVSALTNKSPNAPFRGTGRPEACFAMERMLDLAARELGLDPVAVRRRNLIPPEDLPLDMGLPGRDGKPMVLDSGDYPAALEQCLADFGWDRWRAEQRRARAEGRAVGLGLVCCVEATSLGPYESARVAVDPGGQVVVYTATPSQGQGHQTTLGQIAAAALGVDPGQVALRSGDTGALRYGAGTYASRVLTITGSAVAGAAAAVREKLVALAGHLLEAAPDDLEVDGGRVFVRGAPQQGYTLAQLAARAGPAASLPPGFTPGLEATHYYHAPAMAFSYGIQAAAAEVDLATGVVRILGYHVVHDCGRVINPTVVDGQIYGGIAQGIGGSLLEEMAYDPAGQPVSATFMDYLVPTAREIPDIGISHRETPTPFNPLGTKGAGEGGIVGPAGALAAAVEDALAPLPVRIRRLPISPPALRAAIRAAQQHDTTGQE